MTLTQVLDAITSFVNDWAIFIVPILFLSYANSAAKPLSVTSRETMTAAYESLSNYRVATSPGFFVPSHA